METAQKSQQSETLQPHGRKRNRSVLSCGHCRHRKLKCNRATPCAACRKSGDAVTCSYESHERRQDGQSSLQPMDRDALVSRIDRLESLLLSAVSNNTLHSAQTSPSIIQEAPREVMKDKDRENRPLNDQLQPVNSHENLDMDQLGKDFGILHVEPDQVRYHGGQHWASTMVQIQEIRDYLEVNFNDLGRVAIENNRVRGKKENTISLLRGTNSLLTKEELLSYIPSRAVSDALVAQFFRNVVHDIPVVHESTFLEEYNEHWKSPGRTETTWVALLFSILHNAQLSFEKNEESLCQGYVSEYRRRTIECLVAANYTDPKMYTAECLILHIYADWTGSRNGVEVSLLLGITARLAMSMGMHRDSKDQERHGIKPFQGEIRRRVWAIIRIMDVVCSFHLSLPATIHQSNSHCLPPRNIFEDELHKDMKELPPPKTLSEATQISYTIIKFRLTLELGKILDFAESDDSSDNCISKYEQSLEEAKRMIPHHLSIYSGQEMTTGSVETRKKSLTLDRLYQTSRCILHRKCLSLARHNPSKLRSRGICIDAAMTLLAHQESLYLEHISSYSESVRRRYMFDLTTHDFFTASMAVALDLYYGFESEPFTPSASDLALWGHDRRSEMISALEKSTEFCKMSKDESVEAAYAYGMLRFVVAKARKAQWMIAEQQVKELSGVAEPDSTADTSVPVFEPGPDMFDNELFNDQMAEFDWNLWNQFNSDLQPFLQWEDSAPEST